MGGYWISNLKRWTNIYELGGVQGWPKSWVGDLLEVSSRSCIGAAFGDAMSINVLMRILGRAIYCGGLVPSKLEDVWENIPYKANVSLPGELYRTSLPPKGNAVWT